MRGGAGGGDAALAFILSPFPAMVPVDLMAIRQMDVVSTNEIRTDIKQQLMLPAQSQTQLRT